MFEKIILGAITAALVSLVVSLPIALLSEQREKGIEHVLKVCEETGMYLTEGKAMTCRVLKNQRD